MRGRSLSLSTAVVATTALLATTVAAAPANAKPRPDGQRPLAQVLAADKGFDHNDDDFDIVEALILGVLKAKPASPLNVLTKGDVALTAFLPKDVAFKQLAEDLLGVWIDDESKLANVALLLLARSGQTGVNAAEQLLLYHVVPGQTLTAKAAKKAAGSWLRTAAAGNRSIKVWLDDGDIRLKDADDALRDPTVRRRNINAGNKQIAHGIDRVLIPVKLPTIP